MSQPHSRSPLYSRNATVPIKQEDGFYNERYSSVHSEPWRDPGNVNNLEGNSHWENGPSQGQQEVDHWAKFIEAIGHADRRRPSPPLRHHIQEDVRRSEEKSLHSPRRLPRERLSSPDALNYGAENHRRIASPGRGRNEHNVPHFNRNNSNKANWDSRDSSPRHLQGKRHDRVEHGYHSEEHEDRYHDRSSERWLKPNYREHHSHPKRFRGLDPEEEDCGPHRGFSPHNAPVIVEHDHGISNHDALNRDQPRSRDAYRNREHPGSRDPSRNYDPFREREHSKHRDPPRSKDLLRNREHSRSRDPQRSHDPLRNQGHPRNRDPSRTYDFGRNRDYPRSSEQSHGTGPSRSRESFRHERDLEQHAEIPHGGYDGSVDYQDGEETRFHQQSSVGRGHPMRGRPHQRGQFRMEPHGGEHHEQRTMNQSSDVDLRKDKGNQARASGQTWEKETHPGGNFGVLEQGKGFKGIQQANNASWTDFAGHESLRIKVDMSRPVNHSSHLGYSSERQLSLDLVNVGRQRLDFLPMLEHSGTFRESAMHSGTFAQEIITLVHHVKESFFQGQGITLNERFSCEQHYSLEDEDEFDDDIELEEMEPVINRPLGSSSSSTQIFCNLGSWQPDKRNVAAPGDLRHDLERRRQQRLQGVKITIAGGNFLQMAPQNQESEPVYEDEDKSEPVYEDVCGSGDQMGWSEQAPQQSEQWDDPFQEMPGPNFNGRQNFSQFHNTRPQPRRRRNPRGPNW
uniref:BCLAF1 and THRAP3 family member 3 n=1 Tax=Astyanax mexicanus TaxID=7994 RepID=A0A3B1JDS5_ASTMX